MDLTGRLRSRATPRPLLVAARGAMPLRLAVERELRERGWEFAVSVADADVLVVCGAPDAQLREAVERVWAALPSPRARVDIHDATGVARELDLARARLEDPVAQRADVVARAAHGRREDAESTPDGPAAQKDGDAARMTHGGHEMSHDMHTMHGGDVAGLPMADRATDRDGLPLDQLHVALGPVLSDWPAGLVVRLTLQGDVVQSAEVEALGEVAPGGSSWTPGPAAAALDSEARLLAVCGWDTAARMARRLRDDRLAGVLDATELGRFARRVRRSRTLRWATDGVGRLDDAHGELAGDATSRWLRWFDVAEAGDGAGATVSDRGERARAALKVLPGLLEGQELAAARVVVASLDPDLDALSTAHPHRAAR